MVVLGTRYVFIISLVVPGQPGVLRPSPGFRLLGTVTTDVQVAINNFGTYMNNSLIYRSIK